VERCLGSSVGLKTVVLVLVLEKRVLAERFELVCSPGGEPLCRVASLSVSGRRLPGRTQRVPSPLGLSETGLAELIETNASGAVSGSRLLETDRLATLQSGSPPGLQTNAVRWDRNRIRGQRLD
jgi:hypothetical protein